MKQPCIKDALLSEAAQESMDSFLQLIVDAIYAEIGGALTAENMAELNTDQITLLGYIALRDEVMDGGFVQMIHNGWGGFFFRNPFAKAVKIWGLMDLARVINKGEKLYKKYRTELEKDRSMEDFMALYEQYPEFDDLDDFFVENEENFTQQVATYVDDHLNSFITIEFES